MRRRLRKKKLHKEFRRFGVFIQVSLTGGDTTTLLAEFRAQVLDPHGLAFRGRIGGDALSGFVELGPRDDYEANQERVLVWLLRHPLITAVDNSSLYEHASDSGFPEGGP